MIALWDTTGNDVVRALSTERRNAGGVVSGVAVTLVVSVDVPHVREAEAAAAAAAAAHPCRLVIVVRSPLPASSSRSDESRLDAEIIVGGRLGPAEAVVLRMHGRLARHSESVVIPLLAADVPTVTWWHGPPPDELATDPLGVLAERRITDVARAADPVAALRRRAEDYAPGDTDLAWTRTTPWRSLLVGALDPAGPEVSAATVTAGASDPTAGLIMGWLRSRTGVTPAVHDTDDGMCSIALRLTDGTEVSLDHEGATAVLRRTGQPDREVPLVQRPLGDQLAEELRRLGTDRPYAHALEACTGATGLDRRPSSRTYVWYDPQPVAA
jgi:glucose-6-phosphate dehydrogenase assembly protein OpcA